MARLNGRNVGLDGVVAQQPNYRRSGFRPAWTTMRYEGRPPAGLPVPPGTVLVGARSIPDNLVAIDVPDINPAAVRLAEELGLSPSFETARMYTGPSPDVDHTGLFGITSLELG